VGLTHFSAFLSCKIYRFIDYFDENREQDKLIVWWISQKCRIFILKQKMKKQKSDSAHEMSSLIPVVFLSACTALSIAGNLAKAFTISSSTYVITYHLWKADYCVPGVSCGSLKHSDLGTGTCDFKDQYRAAQAFGILTCMISGVLLLVSVANLFKVFGPISHRNLQFQTLGSFFLIGFQVLMFIIFVTIKNLDCMSSQDPSYDAAPFLFLGCIVVALAYLGWTVFADGDDVAPSHISQPAAAGAHISPEGGATRDRQVNTSQATREPSAPALAAAYSTEAQAAPQLVVEADHSVGQPRLPTLAATSTEEVAVPEGDDWVYDETTGLSWSESTRLFFDPASAQFYDPASEMWFDPQVGRWHHV
jgi:hypothetical protein